MSPLDRPVPPAGEDIHLPEGSAHPVLLTLFITLALIGLTYHWIVLAIGVIGTLWILVQWIAEARSEMSHLPVHHDH